MMLQQPYPVIIIIHLPKGLVTSNPTDNVSEAILSFLGYVHSTSPSARIFIPDKTLLLVY